MKCIIFGGTGFLGEHLSKALLNEGHAVTVYDRASEKMEGLRKKYCGITYLTGDFVVENNFKKLIKEYEIIFHLISTSVPSNVDTVWDVSSNVIPTLRLLEACKESNCLKKFIFFSSGGTVYGKPQIIPVNEIHATNPISSYGIQKLMIEKYLFYYHQFYGVRYHIMRIANPYGEGQAPYGTQGVIAAFLARALSRERLSIWGEGSVIRDFLYVADVVRACLALIKYEGVEKIFNIGSGKGISLYDIIDEIKSLVDYEIEVELCEGRKQDVPVNILDISKAVSELKWEPNVGLREGIKRMINTWSVSEKCFVIK